jgi:Aluminium activated malate transporter
MWQWVRRVPRADPAALQFALRMAILLTVSGLFVLVQTPQGSWPDGMWVLVSVLFVCWFPSLDAASVVEKIFQRLIGTFFGAVLGLSCGFISLYFFHSRPYQASFLGCCMLVFNFLIVFFAGQCKVGGVKVIRKYAYATILCVLTFCICMLPFGCNNNPKWMKGVMRVVNVTIGCLLGAIGAIVVSPKSTAAVLHDKTARQVKLCGEAAEAVLAMAADHFAGNVVVQGLAEELVSAPLETTVRWSLRRVNSGNLSEPSITKSKNADVALQKFEDAMEDWKASKMLFPLTRFDPFHLRFDERSYAAKTSLNKAIARTLARSMRIQTTVVMIDGAYVEPAFSSFTTLSL